MAQNITIWGASYSNVPAVTLPKTGGGTARFTDVSDTTALAADVAAGKYFYAADGSRTLGTGTGGGGSAGTITQDANGYLVVDPNSGGGGGSSYTLLDSIDITASTTSTSNTTLQSVQVAGLYSVFSSKSKFIYIKIRDKAGKRTNYFYGSDTFMLGTTRVLHSYYNSDGTMQDTSNAYGIFPDSSVNSSNTIQILGRYSSSFSKTIDGTYSVEFYTLDYVDGVSPFSV